MLNTEQQIAWDASTEEERSEALIVARFTLANIVHYRNGGSHETEDTQQIAAVLILFRYRKH